MVKSIRYEQWVQRLLLQCNENKGVSQYVLEEFIKQWDERMVKNHEREFLVIEDAG